MANLSPGTLKTQKSLDRLNEKYESLFKDPNIVGDGSVTYDDHSSDEDAPTQRPVLATSHAPKASDGPQLLSVETTALDNPAPIYTKRFGAARRPRIGDIEQGIAATELPPPPDGAISSGNQAAGENAAKKPRTFEIMHSWTQELQQDELVSYINVVERTASEANEISSVRGHIGWLHSEEYDQSLEEFERLFKTYLAPGFFRDRRIIQTTASLLKRVQMTAERKTVGGKYLMTGPMRYDGKSSQGNDSDRPCMFISFPYFAVGDFGSRRRRKQTPNTGRSAKQSSVHPVRMLLQSRYRLESTQKRDEAQSITSMLTTEVQDCIQLPQDGKITVKSNKWKQKIYVPQLWVLSISEEIMITSAPLSETELRSSLLSIKKTSVQGASRGPSPAIVRINLEYDSRREPHVYPVDQCNWYYGLLNKERRILDTLGKDKPGMFKYKLYSKEDSDDPANLVTSDNWLEILHSNEAPEQLDLWMERESLAIEVTPDSDDDSIKPGTTRGRGNSTSPVDLTAMPMPTDLGKAKLVQTNSSTLLKVPTHGRNFSRDSAGSSTQSHATTRPLSGFTPFLQWPLEDSMTKAGGRKHYARARLWLDNILTRLEASCMGNCDMDLQSLAKPVLGASFPITDPSAFPSALISGSTHAEVIRRLQNAAAPPTQRTGVGSPGTLQDASVQRLHKLVEDFKATTNSDNLDIQAWERAFRVLQEYYSLPLQDDDAHAIMVPFLHYLHLGHVDIQAMDRDEVESIFHQSSSPRMIEPPSTREVDAVLAKAKYLLALFIPENVRSTAPDDDAGWDSTEHPLIRLYWGLQDRIIKAILDRQLHATDLTNLLKALTDTVGLAELLHKGVRRRKAGSSSDVENIDSLVIQSPIPDALQYFIYFLFDVVKYVSARSPGEVPGNFSGAVGRRLKDTQSSLRLAQKYLIEEADQSALDAGLGPVVTPEAITLLLLERLGRGVYKNGTINILEIYENIVEKLAAQVEGHASRHLLLELNRVSEEIQIILDVLNQQKRVFELYSQLLDPATFERPTAKRHTKYPYERASIKRNIKGTVERISDCNDLLKRADRLAVQNVQLVESYQDDNNKTLMIFTFVTITFLPLSFVTGFFGMNVQGIGDKTSTVKHFWIIAIPVTVGVGVISLVLTFWGRISRSWEDFKKWLDNTSQEE